MNKITLVIASIVIFLLSFNATASQAHSTPSNNVTDIVDKQLVAYNNQDIDAFLATYHKDVEIYQFPAELMYVGKKGLKAAYGQMFSSLKCLNAKTIDRIVEGRFVTDHEHMIGCTENKDKIDIDMKVTVTYEVVDGLIKRVIFFGG